MKEIRGYELIKEEELRELKSKGCLFRHKKSGARIVVISNDDKNKVFSIGFRTPPEDSTGVAHIIEHTVLCGSKNFPAKDPFIELVKGSLNTFLNAMTYPDKTLYPVASCNDKDFANLMHVYMDAVFYPNIYKKKEIFLQEGWHYELEDPQGELTYNGVVYNEMKGAFSSPEDLLFRLVQQSLFPDVSYSTESGGDPECIPDLTYEQFLDFHRKFYHASNSYIYLYGDMDMEERLRWMDENYLGSFGKEQVDSEIRLQKPFDRMAELTQEYPVTEEEGTEKKTYLAWNAVISTSLDKELYVAFQVLDYVLLSAPGAPLKQALLDAGIGEDVISSYENGIRQPMFSVIVKNAEESQKEAFLGIIREKLETIIRDGISRTAIKAAIHKMEFKYREADFGQFPKGLMYGLQIMDTWLYEDEKPFIHICAEETFAYLKEQIGTGYYEELVKKYLLCNPHTSLVVVKPRIGLTKEKEAKTAAKLKNYKDSLSKEQIEALVEETKKLHEYEMTPSTKEENETIPILSISDIEKKPEPLYNIKKEIDRVPVIHHNVYTNKIAYLRFSFDVSDYVQAGPYLGLLATVLGYMDTKEHSYVKLNNEINLLTGGMSADVNVYNKAGSPNQYMARFEVKTKLLYENMEKAMELLEEVLFSTVVEDEKRLKEILAETRSRLEMQLTSKGHITAIDRAMSYFSESALFEEMVGGVEYYFFICDLLEHFEEKKGELAAGLKKWMNTIFCKSRLLVSSTLDEEGYGILEKALPAFLSGLEERKTAEKGEKLIPVCRNEGFKTSGQVQYVACCGNFIEKGCTYTGVLRIVKVILNYDYLWNHIRVKGGAYGCMSGFSMDGRGYFTSYRDPNLEETKEVYNGIGEYIRSFSVEERDMVKYVIGAISSMDVPLNPSAKGSRSFAALLCGIEESDLQRERDEVLNADIQAIRATAAIMDAIVGAGNFCVVGNEDKIEEKKELFKETKNLC